MMKVCLLQLLIAATFFALSSSNKGGRQNRPLGFLKGAKAESGGVGTGRAKSGSFRGGRRRSGSFGDSGDDGIHALATATNPAALREAKAKGELVNQDEPCEIEGLSERQEQNTYRRAARRKQIDAFDLKRWQEKKRAVGRGTMPPAAPRSHSIRPPIPPIDYQRPQGGRETMPPVAPRSDSFRPQPFPIDYQPSQEPLSVTAFTDWQVDYEKATVKTKIVFTGKESHVIIELLRAREKQSGFDLVDTVRVKPSRKLGQTSSFLQYECRLPQAGRYRLVIYNPTPGDPHLKEQSFYVKETVTALHVTGRKERNGQLYFQISLRGITYGDVIITVTPLEKRAGHLTAGTAVEKSIPVKPGKNNGYKLLMQPSYYSTFHVTVNSRNKERTELKEDYFKLNKYQELEWVDYDFVDLLD